MNETASHLFVVVAFHHRDGSSDGNKMWNSEGRKKITKLAKSLFFAGSFFLNFCCYAYKYEKRKVHLIDESFILCGNLITIKDEENEREAERERNRKELNTHFFLYIYTYIHKIYIYNHNIDRSDYIEDNLLNESKCHDDNKKGAIRIFL